MPFSKYFNPLLELSSDYFFICDSSGHLVQVGNNVIHNLAIADADRLPTIFDLLHPDDVISFRDFFNRALSGQSAPTQNYRLKTKFGTFEFVEFNDKTFRDQEYFAIVAKNIDREHRLTTLLSQTESVTKVGTWEIDMATQALYWSPRTYEIHGKNPKTYRPALEDGLSFFHPDHIPVLTKAVEKMMKTGEGYDLRLKFINARGENIWVRAISQAELKDGNVVRVYGSFEDITEERIKQIEKEKLNSQLKNISDRLAIAVEALGFGVWDWNLLTNQLAWDEHMYQVFQIRKQDFTSDFQAFEKTLVPEDVIKVQNQLNQLFVSKERKFETEFRIVNQFGEIKFIKGSAICFYDENGRPTRLVGTNWDITAERNAQENLRIVRHEMDTFFKSTSEPMCIADLSGYMRRVNPAFIECLGYSEAELLSVPFLNWVHPDDREKTISVLSVLEKGESVSGFENRYIAKNGEIRILNWAAVPDLEQKFIYSSIRDMTLVRQAELKMVESARLASLGEMAGGIAHEINNPLAVIRGKAEQITTRIQDPEYIKTKLNTDLEKIISTVNRITGIIRGLRAFSRDSSKDPFTRTSLSQVVQDALDLCHERLKEKQIDFKILGDPSVELNARPVQLTQVIVNLINNSIDAIQAEQEKWIQIEVEQIETQIRISFIDSGLGVSPKLRSRLMEPFFTTKGPGKGTGLGLSISKGIIEEHHGRFFYDDKSKNTKFVIELPTLNSASKAA